MMQSLLTKSTAALLLAFLATLVKPVWSELPLAGLAEHSTLELSAEERAFVEQLGPMRLAVDPDWKPYEWIDDQGAFRGIAADLVALLARRLGLEIELVATKDWAESLARSRSGEAHALAFLNRTEARDEWLLFTEPYFTDPNVFITRPSFDFIADPARLQGRSIVFPVGTSLEEHVRLRYPNLSVIVCESEEEALRMVQSGEADMTLRSLTMAAHILRRDGLFDLRISGQYPDLTNNFRLGVIRSLPELRDILDKGVRSLSPQDVQDAINNHVAIEAVGWVDYRLTIVVVLVFVGLGSVGSLAYGKLVSLNRRLREREDELSKLSAKLQDYSDHLRLVIDTIPAYIYTKDENGRFLLVNEAFARLFGRSATEVVGRTNLDYGASQEELCRYIEEDRQVLKTGKPLYIAEERSFRPDRSPGWFQTTKIPYRHPESGQPAILGVSIDITEQREQSMLIRHMAQHDGLTDLPNRVLFASLLEQALDHARRGRTVLAVLFIDLDGFKAVNDGHGHEAGDAVLRETAVRIRTTLRASDRAGRIGGDEFAAFLQDLSKVDDAALVAEKLIAAIEEPVDWGGTQLGVSASIGLSSYPSCGADARALLRLADEAMYRAKRSGKGRVDQSRS